MQLALRYLGKPFLEKVWDSSIQEVENLASGKVKSNVWTAYARQIAMPNYIGLTYFDSDHFVKDKAACDSISSSSVVSSSEDAKEDMMRTSSAISIVRGFSPFLAFLLCFNEIQLSCARLVITEVILPLLSCKDLIVAEFRSILEMSHINFDIVSSILDCCKNQEN